MEDSLHSTNSSFSNDDDISYDDELTELNAELAGLDTIASGIKSSAFELHLPNYAEFGIDDDRKSIASSQYYHSAASQASDDYYLSKADGLAFFNAKQNLSPNISGEFEGDNSSSLGIRTQVNSRLSSAANAALFQDEDSIGSPRGRPNLESDATHRSDAFLVDRTSTMTYGRRIARYLSKYKWYYPHTVDYDKHKREGTEHSQLGNGVGNVEYAGNDGLHGSTDGEEERMSSSASNLGAPSLEKAWIYFERITLPRYIVSKENNDEERANKSSFANAWAWLCRGERQMDIATSGEDDVETKLYSPINTPLSQMGDFGLGIGLYFSTLRAITVMMLFATLLNIPNFIYFASEQYSKGQKGVQWWLKGSSVCNVHKWVPCKDCLEHDNVFQKNGLQYGNSTNTSDQLHFALKNDCDSEIFRVGMVNFGTTLLISFGMIIISYYSKQMEVKFDLDEQTAQDYSVVVRNPPIDAIEAREWINFFTENFHGLHVTCCTVVLKNADLLELLVKRRECLKAIEESLSKDEIVNVTDVNALKILAENIESERNTFQRLKAKISDGIPETVNKLLYLNEEILEKSQEKYPAHQVYLTFETEKAQRLVLEKMTVSQYSVDRKTINAIKDPKLLFRGNCLLHVMEPPEPSDLRWKELYSTTKDIAMKVFMTALVCVLVFVNSIITSTIYASRPTWAAIYIAASNIVFPALAKKMSDFERHTAQGNLEIWLFIKIAIFRWTNTVLVINSITPYTTTILNGKKQLLDGVFNIFFAEIFTSSLIQLLDVGGNFTRHFLAPRAKTQEKMNLCMRGTRIFIAERYTNMTKLLFMAVYYSAIYPATLTMCGLALFTNYFVDRFSLMRSWMPSSKIGTAMSHFTRQIVFPITIIFMVMQSVKVWASLPFDALCKSDEVAAAGTYKLYELNNITYELLKSSNTFVTIAEEDKMYSFCVNQQNAGIARLFGFKTSKEMIFVSESQEELIRVYEVFMFVLLCIVGCIILWFVTAFVKMYFVSSYTPVGDDQNEPFSSVKSRSAYIPQVQSKVFAFPFVACSVEDITDFALFEWEDRFRSYEYYDLTVDAKKLLAEKGKTLHDNVFSRMVHEHPPSIPRTP